MPSIQLVARARHRSVELQVRLRHAIHKKVDLDPADLRSYRPISNLSVSSKLLQRVVSSQLVKYLKDNDFFPALQSAYRSNHSTETCSLPFSPHTEPITRQRRVPCPSVRIPGQSLDRDLFPALQSAYRANHSTETCSLPFSPHTGPITRQRRVSCPSVRIPGQSLDRDLFPDLQSAYRANHSTETCSLSFSPHTEPITRPRLWFLKCSPIFLRHWTRATSRC